MHKHQDGDKFTPLSEKMRSTNGLHGHGSGYSLAENVSGHTHINKNNKERTRGQVDPSKKLEGVKNVEPQETKEEKKFKSKSEERRHEAKEKGQTKKVIKKTKKQKR